jgi:hypothetical protein
MKQADNMRDELPRFELLARHLWPKFGDIYDYNLNGGEIVVNPQEWTVELREAVKAYLLSELPADAASYLFTLDDWTQQNAVTKREAVDALIARTEPWEVAMEVRRAAVYAVQTLDELIGDLDDWPSEDERSDVEEWLLEHASEDVLKSLLPRSAWSSSGGEDFTFNFFELLHENQPHELLMKWHKARGVAPSDLTDAEWELLTPFLPATGNRALMLSKEGRARLRRAINGMLYRDHYSTNWIDVPSHYSDHAAIIAIYGNFKHRQLVFGAMLAGLEETAGAERLVEWLRHVETFRTTRP